MAGATIYALCEPGTLEVRYIGKANNSAKRFAAHIRASRCRVTPKDNWIAGLVAAGSAPVLRDILQSEDWEADERRLIAEHRKGGRLLNIADGGVGARSSAPRPRGAFFKLMHRFQSFINEGALQFVPIKAAHKAQRKAALRVISAQEYDLWLNERFDGNLS